MMNALRLIDGFPDHLFKERTGLSLEQLEPILSIAQQRSLVHREQGRISATQLGQRFLNDLFELFIPEISQY